MVIENVKERLREPECLALLAPSMFHPTEARVAQRAEMFMRDSAIEAWACRAEGALAGLIVLAVNGHEGVIRAIATAETMRGRGVGRFLVERGMERFGLSLLTAETDDDAVGFYRRCGFVVSRGHEIGGRARYVCRRTRTLFP